MRKTKIPNRGYRKTAGRGRLYDVQAVNFGWFRRRHGILLENLPPAKQRLILTQGFMKWLEPDPQTYEIIFIIEDQLDWAKAPSKSYWNPYTDDFGTIKQLEKDSILVDWRCAICRIDLVCRADSPKNPENFVCAKCVTSHNSSNKIVDRRIVESSRQLTAHIKTLLTREQGEFIRHVKRSAKG